VLTGPLWLLAEGVIYEDNVIQIGCKLEFNGAQGVITLFFGNKTAVRFLVHCGRFAHAWWMPCCTYGTVFLYSHCCLVL